MFNAELGNYEQILHSSLEFEDGEVVDILCPVCHADLTAYEINPNLANIVMIDEKDKEFTVYFSRVSGERSTFTIDEKNIIEKYGEDSSAYLDYFMAKLKERNSF